MFESFKKTLGFSSARQESKGYRLGTAADNVPSNNPPRPTTDANTKYELFDRLFHGQKLGMSIVICRERLLIDNSDAIPSRPQVDEVHASGEAAKLGINKNDIIIALNDTRLQDFQDFYDIIPAVERPVKISFYRPKSAVQPTASASNTSSAPPSLVPQEKGGSIFNFRGASTQQPQPTVSEEDLQARREERLRAVNDRTQAIEKKFKKSSFSSGKSPTALSTAPKSAAQDTPSPTNQPTPIHILPQPLDNTPSINNAETEKIVQQVKAEEYRVEQSLGYNPFRPHMSFSGNAATAASLAAASHPSPPTPNTRSLNPNPTNNNNSIMDTNTHNAAPAVYVEEDVEIIAEVDDSFAMLLSLTDADQDRAKTAVQTVQKLLLNLHGHKQEPKFRVIRLSNKAFHAKVGTVPGGIELLLAAGFRFETGGDGIETSSSPAVSAKMKDRESEAETQDALNDTEASDACLVHSMDAYAERKLNYTVSRLQELLEMQRAV